MIGVLSWSILRREAGVTGHLGVEVVAVEEEVVVVEAVEVVVEEGQVPEEMVYPVLPTAPTAAFTAPGLCKHSARKRKPKKSASTGMGTATLKGLCMLSPRTGSGPWMLC